MIYCLDTNTCIEAMRNRGSELADRFAAVTPEDIVVPAMVKAELLLGALKSHAPERVRATVARFLSPFEIIPFDDHAVLHYAEIRAHLERQGLPIGPNDLVIAATARSRGLRLVTHNTDEFRRVPGLGLEDWQAGTERS